MRILVTGTFDDLHPGHHFVLSEASRRGELFVIVARDANVKRFKGRSPLQDETQRKAAIEQAYPHAHVVLGDSEDFLRPVREIHPDLILLGYDQNLPPGVDEQALGCTTERLHAFEPHKHKSSVRRRANG